MSVNIVDKTTGNLIKVAGNPVEDASGIHYSHTTSGLAATNVQDAIDESYDSLKSGLTTLDNEVNGDATTYDFADVITIEDAVPANLADCKVKVEPVQDLHGYSQPWVGGAGKNKLPMTVDSIKAANTEGTWSGDTYTINGVSFTILKDADGNVTGVKTGNNQTAIGGNASFYIVALSQDVTLESGQYIGNGCPANGSTSTYYVRFTGGFDASSDIGEGTGVKTVTTSAFSVYIRVTEGATVSDLVFTPMIRLATETDATFAPYTNICPISGHTEASVQRDGKNLFDKDNVDYVKAYVLVNSGELTIGDLYSNEYSIYLWLPKGTYAFQRIIPSTDITDKRFRVRRYDNVPQVGDVGDIVANYTAELTGTFTTNKDGYVLIFMFNGKTAWDARQEVFDSMQIEVGQTATPYVPYAGKTYTIALGSTIYGGTVDFDSGVMTVDRAFIELDASVDEEWTAGSVNERAVFRCDNCTENHDNYYGSHSQWLSNIAVAIDSDSSMSSYTGQPNDWLIRGQGDISKNILVGTPLANKDMTLSDFKTMISTTPLQISYPLATPTTIQLTPQQIQLLKGTNTLTASTGQISVTVNGVSGSIGAVQEQVNGLAEDVAVLDNLITNDFVTVADGFYCEDAYKAKYTAIGNGTHGIVQINGVIKASSALTASTDYTICSVPFTSIREAFGLEFNESGTIAIDKDSGDVVYTPSASVAQYTPIKFSIAFCF